MAEKYKFEYEDGDGRIVMYSFECEEEHVGRILQQFKYFLMSVSYQEGSIDHYLSVDE